MDSYDDAEPINLGGGADLSIREAAETIRRVVDYTGELRFDTSKPDGQPRRRLDTTKAEKEFGFKAKTRLEAGLMQTIEWYMKNKATVVC